MLLRASGTWYHGGGGEKGPLRLWWLSCWLTHFDVQTEEFGMTLTVSIVLLSVAIANKRSQMVSKRMCNPVVKGCRWNK